MEKKSAIDDYGELLLVEEALMRGRFMKNGVERPGYHMLHLYMSVTEAKIVLKNVFKKDPICNQCGHKKKAKSSQEPN